MSESTSFKKETLKKIFKQYDIRGEYPKEINEKIAYSLGRAIMDFARKGKKKQIDVIVGHDSRRSSFPIFKSLSSGIKSLGGNVFYLGVCTTPMFYFASGYIKKDELGVMITASHLPENFNGFKMVRDFPVPIDAEFGLGEIKEEMEENRSSFRGKRGKTVKLSFKKQYIEKITEDFKKKKTKDLKIIIDTGNCPTGDLIADIFKGTKCKIIHINSKVKSSFSRPLDCNKEKNLKDLKKSVLKNKAHFGVAFDGDGDRIAFLDEKGKIIQPTIIASLISSILLRGNPGKKILYTVNQGRILKETIEKNGGKAVLSKVGHSSIKRKMKKERILFGSEVSAHYYHNSRFFTEAPFFVLFKIIEEMSKTGKNLTELTKPFQKYYYSGEINFKVKDKNKPLKILEGKFKKGKISKIDGLRIDFKNWWFNVRPSHTEPVLRLVLEAETQKLLREKTHILSDLIHG